MALTTEEIATYTARLAEAEGALHTLLIGGQPKVFVDANGERIEYTMASSARLRAYILELQILLGKKTVTGPMTPYMV